MNIASACRCSPCAAWYQSDPKVLYLVRSVAEQHLMQHGSKARAAVVHGPEACMDCGDCCFDVVSGGWTAPPRMCEPVREGGLSRDHDWSGRLLATRKHPRLRMVAS